MEKLVKICCVAGLGASLLFVSACSEEHASAPKQTKQSLVVSKVIQKPDSPVALTPVPVDTGEKKAQISDLNPGQDSVKESQTGSHIDGATGLQKAGISMPMEKYDSKDRVDPFIPLIAEKKELVGSAPSGDSKIERVLTPLEKLELSQVKLVAVVEMQDRAIAMVEEASGKGYEVAIGTYIGPNGGRVTSITRTGIKIEETVKDYQGKSLKRYEEIKFHKSEDEE